jgi:glycosyltransferase involved in cell wall biosynthesis
VATVKLIALLPFKDEAWILPAYLSSVVPIVDEIVAVDDGSTDASRAMLERAGAQVIDNLARTDAGWAEHSIREQLLALGRARGGTHFLGLDADEALTTPCRTSLRPALAALQPGQKLALQWVTLWKSRDAYRSDGSVWTDLFKDFAWADGGAATGHGYAFLGVGRTAGPNDADTWVRMAPAAGAVLHYQFVAWRRTQVKQAWYRCSELINTPERAFEINELYAISDDDPAARTVPLPPGWAAGIDVPADIEALPPGWHLDAILAWFDRYGETFFEPLAIWDIPELHDRFLARIGREPRPKLALTVPERIRRRLSQR